MKPLLQPTTTNDSLRSHISSVLATRAGEGHPAAQADFARGQRRDVSRGYVYGDFATGIRSLGGPRVTGSFATGMRLGSAPTTVGDFATGMRTLPTAVAIHHLTSAERALPVAA
jgi:hypothetical protein